MKGKPYPEQSLGERLTAFVEAQRAYTAKVSPLFVIAAYPNADGTAMVTLSMADIQQAAERFAAPEQARDRLVALANLIERPPLDDVLLERSVALQAAKDIRALLVTGEPA